MAFSKSVIIAFFAVLCVLGSVQTASAQKKTVCKKPAGNELELCEAKIGPTDMVDMDCDTLEETQHPDFSKMDLTKNKVCVDAKLTKAKAECSSIEQKTMSELDKLAVKFAPKGKKGFMLVNGGYTGTKDLLVSAVCKDSNGKGIILNATIPKKAEDKKDKDDDKKKNGSSSLTVAFGSIAGLTALAMLA